MNHWLFHDHDPVIVSTMHMYDCETGNLWFQIIPTCIYMYYVCYSNHNLILFEPTRYTWISSIIDKCPCKQHFHEIYHIQRHNRWKLLIVIRPTRKIFQILNLCRTEFIGGNIKTSVHFLSFLNMDRLLNSQFTEDRNTFILHIVNRMVAVTWWGKRPGHQQLWYWPICPRIFQSQIFFLFYFQQPVCNQISNWLRWWEAITGTQGSFCVCT